MVIRIKKLFHHRVVLLLILIKIMFVVTIAYFSQTTITYVPIKYENRSQKYILYWNDLFGWKDMGLGFGQKIFQGCPVSTCVTTNNRSIMPVDQFDAIVFHAPTFWFWTGPKVRNVNQKYIYYNKESPVTHPRSTYGDDFYNWTMTYRVDSDIFSPYGDIKKQKIEVKIMSEEQFKNKTKMVAWFVSTCNSMGRQRRDNYVRELQKYIQVDIYGECGNYSCPASEYSQCYQMLQENYRFYLSFENSMCQDYVTEKLFNLLNYNIIPVVLGSVDYAKVAPPLSVVNTNDFANPQSLAKYLHELGSDPKEYLKYFEWKKDYIVTDGVQEALCQLCAKLHQPITYSSYNDIHEWVVGKHKDVCYL